MFPSKEKKKPLKTLRSSTDYRRLDAHAFLLTLTEHLLETITKEKKRGFIMGDFNIDLLKYNHNHQVNTFVNLVYSYSFFFRVSIGLLEFAQLKMAPPSR